ncbi:MAG: hypothetical protein HY228_00535 [Candidatus Yonathbacteria bacterium]|nr:hypothetical protein [Candidatus Yonathbacteria bacterium]
MFFFKQIYNTIRAWFEEAPHFTGTIIATERIGSRIQKVTIALPEPISKPFPIGCYIQAQTSGCVPRAYSVAKANTTSFTLLVSFAGMGVGARYFAEAPVGEKVVCYGPFDDFPYRYGTGRSKVFFATSTGVAPFRRMTEEALKENVESVLLLGTPKEEDIAFKKDFEILAQNPLFRFIPVLSAGSAEWKGARGFVTNHTADIEDFLKKSDVYICGVPIMTMGVLDLLKKIGVPEKQIFVQKFG